MTKAMRPVASRRRKSGSRRRRAMDSMVADQSAELRAQGAERRPTSEYPDVGHPAYVVSRLSCALRPCSGQAPVGTRSGGCGYRFFDGFGVQQLEVEVEVVPGFGCGVAGAGDGFFELVD